MCHVFFGNVTRTVLLLMHQWCFILQGFARTQVPTNINYDPEVITLGLLAGVSLTEVQWIGLFLGEAPT